LQYLDKKEEIMEKIIIFKQENGSAAVMTPTPDYLQDHTIEECAAKDVPAGAEFYIIEKANLPEEHNDFFNAWEVVAGAISINHTKAKGITKERLRAERAPLLTALDVQYQRAQEDGRDTAIIVSEKQKLRDITKLADEATTLEELKALKA
jgi:hypothetical protein